MSGNPIEFGYLDHHPLEVTIFPRFTYALSPSLACFPSDGHHLENESKALSLHCLFPYGVFFFFLFRKNQQSPISAPLLLPWAGKTKCTSDILLPGKTKEGKVPVSPLLPHPSPTKAHSSLFPSLSPSLSHCFHLQHNP